MGLLLSLSSVAQAEAIKAYLSSDSARFSYATEAFGQQFGRLELDAGLLFTDHDDPARDGDYLAHVGIQVRGESLDFPLIVSIGGRAYYGEAGVHDVSGIGIGGDLLILPESWGGFGIGAFLYHAPEVVSFGDSAGLTEYGLMASFQITPQASIVAGMQKVEVEIDSPNAPDVEIEKGGFFGVDIRF